MKSRSGRRARWMRAVVILTVPVIAGAVSIGVATPAMATVPTGPIGPDYWIAEKTFLFANSQLHNNVVQLRMQNDGNLVLYCTTGGKAIWSSGTWMHPGSYMNFQPDANLVVYDSETNTPYWSSGTYSSDGHERVLVLQGDANMVIYDRSFRNDPVWSSNTYLACPDAKSEPMPF